MQDGCFLFCYVDDLAFNRIKGRKQLLFQRVFFLFHESFQEISYEIKRMIPMKDPFVHLNSLYTNRVISHGKF